MRKMLSNTLAIESHAIGILICLLAANDAKCGMAGCCGAGPIPRIHNPCNKISAN